MSGELRTGQFRYTITADDDFVIGSPLNAGITTPKYLVFQVTQNVGFGANPHIKCEYSSTDINPGTGLPGTWRIKFSNDGANTTDFAFENLPNVFTAANTFNSSFTVNGEATFKNTATFTGAVSVAYNKLNLTGLTASRAIVSSDSGNGLVVTNVTSTELGYLSGAISNIQAQIDTKAPKDSPAFVGSPTAPTPPIGTKNTQLATTEFVQIATTTANIKGYDCRSIILNDIIATTKYYKMSVYNNIVSFTPYAIPGTDYILLKDVSTGSNYKFTIINGVLTKSPTDMPGPYSYTVLDYKIGTFHKVFYKNGLLMSMPE